MAASSRIGLASRAGSVAGLAALLIVGILSAFLWIPAVAIVDLVLGRRRLPLVRLGLVGLWWAALEIVGIGAATGLWALGQSRNTWIHYRLQRWWASSIWRGIVAIVGVDLRTEGFERLRPGPVVVMSRHVSLADPVVTSVILTSQLGLRPRMVLKAELEVDPCLGVVGNRLPNVFVDRQNAESTGAVEAIGRLGAGLGADDAVVIFPEGTRSNPDKRERALFRIAESDPERARRLASLRHLLPPRGAGSRALLDQAGGVDVVTVWHTGLDGLDTFRGMVAAIARGPVPLRFVARRWPRSEVPDGPALRDWMDDRWLEMDDEVDGARVPLSSP